MNSRYLLLAPVVLLAAALFSCSDDPTGPAPIVIPGPGEPVVYSKHIEPIFYATCGGSGCHLNGDNLGGIAMNTWEQVVNGSEDYGAGVVPFSARKSMQFQHINTDSSLGPVATPRMPLSRDPLPMEQILLIKRWIDEGAKNDAGQIPLDGADRPRIFASAATEGLITVIDFETQRVARYIDLRNGAESGSVAPHAVLLSPDRRHLFVSMPGRVARYDARTFAKLGEASAGAYPGALVFSPDGSTLFAGSTDLDLREQFITRIDPVTMRTIDTIGPVGYGPHGVVPSRDGRSLYTLNTYSDDISEIDLATGVVVRTIPISFGNPLPRGFQARNEPYHGVLSPDGGMLWITCRKSGQVRVVDLTAGAVVDSMFVGVRPHMAGITPDGSELWVPNQITNSVSIINLQTRKITATINQLRMGPLAVEFSGDGRTAFVACEAYNGNGRHGEMAASGSVYAIETRTRRLIRQIEVGATAESITVGK